MTFTAGTRTSKARAMGKKISSSEAYMDTLKKVVKILSLHVYYYGKKLIWTEIHIREMCEGNCQATNNSKHNYYEKYNWISKWIG